MNDDKKKKYKGIKFLKVDQPVFNNAKKYNRKSSYNSISINNKLSSTDNKKRKKSCKSPIVDGLIKSEEEKTPVNKKEIPNKNYQKLNSISKVYPKKIEELVLLKKPGKKKEEEKKDGKMLLTRFGKANIKPLKLLKTISAKNVFSNKSIIINNIVDNNDESNENKFKSAKIVNNNNKINYNANISENDNNTNYCKNSKNIFVDKVKKENKEEKQKNQEKQKKQEKSTKNNNNSQNLKKFLCCL